MKRKKSKGYNMNQIAQRITATPAATIQDMASRIAREAPTLADLNSEQLEQIAKIVITNKLTAELTKAADIAGIDWTNVKETFLNYAKSTHTRRAYNSAIAGLETWTAKKGLNPLELTPATADSYIHYLKEQGKANATTRRDIAAVSAFYTFLERETIGKIKNPIRGTKQRPPKENKKDTVIPTAAEYNKIIKALPPIEKAIIIILAQRGLRAGALPTLELKDGKYHGKSKGKALKENDIKGITLPAQATAAMKAAKLDIKKPFAWITANAIENRINTHIGKLYAQGKIRAAYSAHDFRHFFAVNEYKTNKDIFRLSKLLNHAGIQITQTYLKSLGVKI